MPYIAAKEIPVQRDGKTITLRAGEPVPEAEQWNNPKAWERHGWIRWVEGKAAAKAPAAPAPFAALPEEPTNPGIDAPAEEPKKAKRRARG